MSDLAKCPCGFVPESLCVAEGDTYRWRIVWANCANPDCPGWMIEIKVPYKLPEEGIMKTAIKEWNNAMRGAE